MKSSNLKASLPTEIWLLIAAYIPWEEVENLLGLNSFFFNLIVAARYKVLHIGLIDNDMLKKLERFHDPMVSWRVRRLDFKPSYELPSQVSVRKMIRILTPVLQSMTNVTELILNWRRSQHAVYLERSLPNVWRSLGPTLRSLELGGDLPALEIFIQSFPSEQGARCLTTLEELSLGIVRCPNYERRRGGTSVLAGIMASFINQLAPKIRRFSITTSIRDLSPLFANLSIPFPLLNYFVIDVPFNGSFDWDKSSLARFLRSHSRTIRHAKFLINHNRGHSSTYWTQWLCDIASDPAILVSLEELYIDPTDNPAGCEALVSIIRRSADTLTTLQIQDHRLTHEEVVAIVSVFSRQSKLARLWLEVRQLDTKLIDLLATHLPGLQQLRLHLQPRYSGEEISALADISKHYYPDWKLQDLVIWRTGVKRDNMMRQIATCAPSINTFVNT